MKSGGEKSWTKAIWIGLNAIIKAVNNGKKFTGPC